MNKRCRKSIPNMNNYIICSSFAKKGSSLSLTYTIRGGCTSLKEVTLSRNLESIGPSAFRYCPSLANIYMKAETPPLIRPVRRRLNRLHLHHLQTVRAEGMRRGVPPSRCMEKIHHHRRDVTNKRGAETPLFFCLLPRFEGKQKCKTQKFIVTI